MTNPVTAVGSRPNHGYVELTERMRHLKSVSDQGMPPVSVMLKAVCAQLGAAVLGMGLGAVGGISDRPSRVLLLAGALGSVYCMASDLRAFRARREAAQEEYHGLLEQPHGGIHEVIAMMTRPATLDFPSEKSNVCRRMHERALERLLCHILAGPASPTDEQFEKARSRSFQMPDGSSLAPARVGLVPNGYEYIFIPQGLPFGMETAHLRISLLDMDRIGDRFQVAIDSILDHAEIEPVPRKALLLVESAFTLVMVFARLQHTARATWDPNATDDQALEQREHEEAFLVARQMRLQHSSGELSALKDLHDSNQCPELSSSLRCLRRTILDTVSIDEDFGLDRCSEKLRSMYPEAYRSAQHRLVSHTIVEQLWKQFFVHTGWIPVDGFKKLLDVVEKEEGALRNERAAVEGVIEVLGDSEEMRAALQGPGSTQPNGLPSLPLPHLVLAGMVGRQQLADLYGQEHRDQQRKIEEVEAIQIEAIQKRESPRVL